MVLSVITIRRIYMHNINIVKDMLKAGVYNEQLQNIYNCTDSETEFYAKRYIRL